MKLVKLTILSGAAAIAVVAITPAAATWYSHGENPRGGWSTSGGWGSSSYGGTTSSTTSTGSGGTTSTSSSSGSSSSNGASSGGTPIPEPSNLFMLALGVAGLVTGRYAARKKRRGL